MYNNLNKEKFFLDIDEFISAFYNSQGSKRPSAAYGDKKDPLACYSMAIEGSCKRDNCTYSHDPSFISICCHRWFLEV